MAENVVAETYSEALFLLAKEQNKVQEMETDFLYVEQVLTEQPELERFLNTPVIETSVKLDLLGKVFGEAIGTVSLHGLYVIVKRNRERHLLSIVKSYIAKSRADRGIVEATVTVAKPLSPDVEAMLREKLKAVTGKEFMLRVKEDPKLIGGFLLQVGDTRIDASMLRRLEDMRKSLLTAGTI